MFRQPIHQIKMLPFRQPSFAVRAGQEQERVGDSPKVFGLTLHGGEHTLVFFRGPLSAQGNFDLTEDGGQRSAKLVRRIAGKALLPLERVSQAIQQAVKGAAEVFELIFGCQSGEPLLEIIRIHLTNRCGHAGYRKQRSATDDATGQHCSEPDCHGKARQRPRQKPQRGLDGTERNARGD